MRIRINPTDRVLSIYKRQNVTSGILKLGIFCKLFMDFMLVKAGLV